MIQIDIFNEHVKAYEAWYEKYPNVYLSEVAAIKEQLLKLPENINGIEVGLGTWSLSQPLGIQEGIEPSYEIGKNYHIDHMDPLNNGGQDSIRNAVYVCKSCNMEKSDTPFVLWLERLPPENKKVSREIYIEKHGHQPEDFEPGFVYGGNWIEALDWDQLKKLKDEGDFE